MHGFCGHVHVHVCVRVFGAMSYDALALSSCPVPHLLVFGWFYFYFKWPCIRFCVRVHVCVCVECVWVAI